MPQTNHRSRRRTCNGWRYGNCAQYGHRRCLISLSLRTSRGLQGRRAAQGGIPRLLKIAGQQLASEILLTGRVVPAQEACQRFGFVNKVVDVDASETPEEGQRKVLEEALRFAQIIVANSPEAVRVTKRGLSRARQNIDESTIENAGSTASRALYAGKNIREGLLAFKEVSAIGHRPRWVACRRWADLHRHISSLHCRNVSLGGLMRPRLNQSCDALTRNELAPSKPKM